MSVSAASTNILSRDLAGQLEEVCRRRNIVWLAVFGSVARGEARADSDVDLLVEFEPGTRMTYIDLENVAEELSPIFGGRWVDIGSRHQLHWYIREKVLANARVLYEG